MHIPLADPEQKRKIIGRLFVEVFQREAAKLTGVKWLAQGTIYPYVIESASAKGNKAHTIKSHHNVGGLPDTLHLALLEPLRELFKDEVRKLGIELGLPREMVHRHPFPGPGLGVRILKNFRLCRRMSRCYDPRRAGVHSRSIARYETLPTNVNSSSCTGPVGGNVSMHYVAGRACVGTFSFSEEIP